MSNSFDPFLDQAMIREAIIVMLSDCRNPTTGPRFKRLMRDKPETLARFLVKEANRLANDGGFYERIGPMAKAARWTLDELPSNDKEMTGLLKAMELVGVSLERVQETINDNEGIAIDRAPAEN